MLIYKGTVSYRNPKFHPTKSAFFELPDLYKLLKQNDKQTALTILRIGVWKSLYPDRRGHEGQEIKKSSTIDFYTAWVCWRFFNMKALYKIGSTRFGWSRDAKEILENLSYMICILNAVFFYIQLKPIADKVNLEEFEISYYRKSKHYKFKQFAISALGLITFFGLVLLLVIAMIQLFD